MVNNYQHLEPSLLKQIESNADVKNFAKGEVILNTGNYIRSMMLLKSGKVKVFRSGADGGEFFLYFLTSGEACANSMLHQNVEKSLITAVAEEESEIVFLPLEKVTQWMAEYKSWYEFVIHSFQSKFEELIQLIDNIAFNALDERLEFYLSRLAASNNSSMINVTHQQIANDLNSSREVVSRLLKKLEQQNKIIINRNSIELIGL